MEHSRHSWVGFRGPGVRHFSHNLIAFRANYRDSEDIVELHLGALEWDIKALVELDLGALEWDI